MKKIAILGSTGSIGQNSLKVARHLGKKQVKITALSAKSNIDLLEAQAREFSPEFVAVYDEAKALELQKRLPHIPVLAGMEGLTAVATHGDTELVIAAISGVIGLKPTADAIIAGKDVGFATKEVLVASGKLFTDLVKKHGVKLIPIDSELTALFQCLKEEKATSVNRLVITASGGPFRGQSAEALKHVTVKDALKHPNYAMGPKVTIDSSTLMNKGLEMIEAHFLFSMPVDKIDVIVHKEQIIHSLVEFCDGSMLAQMGDPDMLSPIQYVITHPGRMPGLLKPFDFIKNSSLTFMAPDKKTFPCLQIAYDAAKAGKSYPCYMNGINEELVRRFLANELAWSDIAKGLQELLNAHTPTEVTSLKIVEEITQEATAKARDFKSLALC